MFKFPVEIPELDQLPAEKRRALLTECLESSEFARRTRRLRIISLIAYLILVLAPPWFVKGPFARSETQANVYIAIAFFGLAVVQLAVPFYFHPRILRRMIRQRLRDA